jgi:predicted nucleic acid-binding protein
MAPAAAERAPPFLDTNVLLYVLSADASKADRAETLLEKGATISVQVLNEFASVARRKPGMSWDEIKDVLSLIRQQCRVRDLTVTVHDQALTVAQRYQLAWYDALIVSAALDAHCSELYSEDMHAGLKVNGVLTIRNPFAGG